MPGLRNVQEQLANIHRDSSTNHDASLSQAKTNLHSPAHPTHKNSAHQFIKDLPNLGYLTKSQTPNANSTIVENLLAKPTTQPTETASNHNATLPFPPDEQKAVLSFLKENNIPFDAKNPPQNAAELKQLLSAYLSKAGIPPGAELDQAVALLMEHLIGSQETQGQSETKPPQLDMGTVIKNALDSGNFKTEGAQIATKLIQELKILGVAQTEFGEFLVTNLKVLTQGNPEDIKFALLKLGESLKMGGPELMALLKMPNAADAAGQQILQLLQKNVGELQFLKLINLAQQAKDAVPFDAKQVSPNMLASLERWFANSKKNPHAGDLGFFIRPDGTIGWRNGKENFEDKPQGVFADVYRLLGLRERYHGNQRLYTFVGYAAFAAVITLAFLTIIFKL